MVMSGSFAFCGSLLVPVTLNDASPDRTSAAEIVATVTVYGFCEGMLRITPDGVARFDCTRGDARRHCHHLSFTSADIREIQIKNDGTLHLTAHSGNFDFLGDSASIQSAATALHSMSTR